VLHQLGPQLLFTQTDKIIQEQEKGETEPEQTFAIQLQGAACVAPQRPATRRILDIRSTGHQMLINLPIDDKHFISNC